MSHYCARSPPDVSLLKIISIICLNIPILIYWWKRGDVQIGGSSIHDNPKLGTLIHLLECRLLLRFRFSIRFHHRLRPIFCTWWLPHRRWSQPDHLQVWSLFAHWIYAHGIGRCWRPQGTGFLYQYGPLGSPLFMIPMTHRTPASASKSQNFLLSHPRSGYSPLQSTPAC